MGYFSYKEEEAYREGRRDAEYGRTNYDYDRHFGGDADRAYYDGIRDQEREDESRRERYEEDRRQEERDQQRRDQHYEYMRDMEDAEMARYYNECSPEEQEPPEQQYAESDDLPF